MLDREKEYNTTMGLIMAAVAIAMLVCIANAGTAIKFGKSEALGAATNAETFFPPTSSDTESVCIEIWKGEDGAIKRGEHLRVHKLTDTLFVGPDGVKTWGDVCLDDQPKAWEKFQPSVQIWKKGQKEKFEKDTTNKYVIELADLSKKQKDDLADKKVKKLALGNYRLKQEKASIAKEGKLK